MLVRGYLRDTVTSHSPRHGISPTHYCTFVTGKRVLSVGASHGGGASHGRLNMDSSRPSLPVPFPLVIQHMTLLHQGTIYTPATDTATDGVPEVLLLSLQRWE